MDIPLMACILLMDFTDGDIDRFQNLTSLCLWYNPIIQKLDWKRIIRGWRELRQLSRQLYTNHSSENHNDQFLIKVWSIAKVPIPRLRQDCGQLYSSKPKWSIFPFTRSIPQLWINCSPAISILGDIWDRAARLWPQNIQLDVVSYMGVYNSLLGPIGAGSCISFWRQ